MREAMPSPLIRTSNSFSKPNIRKHSSSENLLADHKHCLHLQHQENPFSALPPFPLPLSPTRKGSSALYSCLCFIFFFFIITVVAYLHCSTIDPPRIIEQSLSISCCNTKEQVISPYPSEQYPSAWKGLGTVFVRGTRSMSELVVAHIAENTQPEDFRLFLRTSFRSGVAARADLVFLFSPDALPTALLDILHEENCSFHRLLRKLSSEQGTGNSSTETPAMSDGFFNGSLSAVNLNAYRRAGSDSETSAQPFWGTRMANISDSNRSDGAMLMGWGSMVGFDTSELNADNALQGFFDDPPVMLRRWPCYQMLLGMVRHRFKHVLLTDVSGVVMLKDPFTMATRRKVGLYLSFEDRAWGASNAAELGVNKSILNVDQEGRQDRIMLSAASRGVSRRQSNPQTYVHQRVLGGRRRAWKGAAAGGLYERVYGKRMWNTLEDFERRKKLVNSNVILGGIHQIRGLANAMVTEIVRVAMQRANRDAFPDSVLLSYLLHKSSSVLGKRVLDHLHLLANEVSFVHSLAGSQQRSLFMKRTRVAYELIQGNCKSKRWVNAARKIRSDICASTAGAMVYHDCAA